MARLNSTATQFEYEVDDDGEPMHGTLREWN